MKKTLSIILAVMMLLGLSVTAFADGNTTTITATKGEPEPVTYEIVVPTGIPTITEAGDYEVGLASVTNIQNDTDNTMITYTLSTTDFINNADSSKVIPAFYFRYYDKGSGYEEQNRYDLQQYINGEIVHVYQPDFLDEIYTSDLLESCRLYVRIEESDWNVAEDGDYAATVTYNFKAEEVWQLQDILDTVEGGFPNSEDNIYPPDNAWVNTDPEKPMEMTAYTYKWEPDYSDIKELQLGNCCFVPTVNPVAKENNNYVYYGNDGAVVTFTMNNGVLQSITVSGSDVAGYYYNVDGTYVPKS